MNKKTLHLAFFCIFIVGLMAVGGIWYTSSVQEEVNQLSAHENHTTSDTIAMVHSWSIAINSLENCYRVAEGGNAEAKACEKNFVEKINRSTQLCHIKLLEFSENSNGFGVKYSEESFEDPDDDGIFSRIEFEIGLNPCSAQSFPGLPDAELDHDKDGILNSKDTHPGCTPQEFDDLDGPCPRDLRMYLDLER